MEGKTCIITGGNSGIGKAAVHRFAKQGAIVTLACRNRERGEKAAAEIQRKVPGATLEVMELDMSSMESICHFAKAFAAKHSHLDILVHNAAHFDHKQKGMKVTEEGFEAVFATNHLGPFLLTKRLEPLLLKADHPKIITVGTEGLRYYWFTKLDVDDLKYEKNKFTIPKAYYNSKLAHLMFTLEYAKRSQVPINCVEVTNVKLAEDRLEGLPAIYRLAYKLKSRFSISADSMASVYEYLAFDPNVESLTGCYINKDKIQTKGPKQAYDETFREELWKKTEKLLDPWLKNSATI